MWRSTLGKAGLKLDAVTAYREVKRWLYEVANEPLHDTTQAKPDRHLANLPKDDLQELRTDECWRKVRTTGT